MTGTKQSYTLWDDLEKFDLGDSGACPSEWNGRKALYLGKLNSAIFLREEVKYPAYRLHAEVAIPGDVGFVGLVFGAADSGNYELIYLAPFEIQYDPIMNGSMTWQIYNGPSYQKPLPNTTGEWRDLTVEVDPEGAKVYFGNRSAEPSLVLSSLQHGGQSGKVGVWSYLPAYIRNFSIEEFHPVPASRNTTALEALISETFITKWHVSSPFITDRPLEPHWTPALVEENGVLNINRIHRAEQGVAVEVKSTVRVAEQQETILTLGFSDSIRLWINDTEVYQGNWCWNPPEEDGRIRPDFASVPVQWRRGLNSIRAELLRKEDFGWGLAVKTGLANMS